MMNDAWKYCETLDAPDAPRALAGAALTAYQTIARFRREGLDPEAVDWGFLLRELREALATAGHPAGTA